MATTAIGLRKVADEQTEQTNWLQLGACKRP